MTATAFDICEHDVMVGYCRDCQDAAFTKVFPKLAEKAKDDPIVAEYIELTKANDRAYVRARMTEK